MKHSEKRSRDAALGIVRSEMLLPDEAGFLETEGPMEKTHKVTQKQVSKPSVRLSSRMCAVI